MFFVRSEVTKREFHNLLLNLFWYNKLYQANRIDSGFRASGLRGMHRGIEQQVEGIGNLFDRVQICFLVCKQLAIAGKFPLNGYPCTYALPGVLLYLLLDGQSI